MPGSEQVGLVWGGGSCVWEAVVCSQCHVSLPCPFKGRRGQLLPISPEKAPWVQRNGGTFSLEEI